MVTKGCDGCTLCCDLFPVGAPLNKEHSTMCGYCVLKKGCSIWKDRPDICKSFDCAYLQTEDMGIELRPDKCGVVFEKVTDKIWVGIRDNKNIDGWRKKEVMDYCNKLKEQGISVVMSSYTPHPKMILLADGHTEEGVFAVIRKVMTDIEV